MSLLGGNPKGGAMILENSSQMAYKYCELAVGADIKYRLNDDMLSYFEQASLSIYLGWSGLSSTPLIYGEICTANIIEPGAYANYI